SRRRRDKTRGQSLVEFALVLPILMLLTLIALDFGRVYLGYINLQNMARIAANFAANNPTAWAGTPDAAALKAQVQYKNQIVADAAASNCSLPKVGTVTQVPTPVFIDRNGNGTTSDIGDTAEVRISCTFGVITPGISNIVGKALTVSASSAFPVKSGMTATGAGGGGGGSAPNAAFTGNGVISPTAISGTTPFTVEFRDTSGGNPSQWVWTFPGGTPDSSSAQDPLNVTFSGLGQHLVELQAKNILGTSTVSMIVTVNPVPSTVNFTSAPVDPPSGPPGFNVTFVDASAAGGTSYVWTFGAGEGGVTNPDNQSVTHTYAAAGSYTVTLAVTYPGPTGTITTTKTGYVNIATAMCTAPFLNGVHRNNAPAAWSAEGFTGLVTDAPGYPNGNYIITAQAPTGGAPVVCTSGVVVNRP
ncbi:MAG: PKD domain-containing protein, partial [Chloroflexota bacterium]